LAVVQKKPENPDSNASWVIGGPVFADKSVSELASNVHMPLLLTANKRYPSLRGSNGDWT
jgi:hypothetical protein